MRGPSSVARACQDPQRLSSSCFPPPQGMPPATLSPSMSTLQLGKLRLGR